MSNFSEEPEISPVEDTTPDVTETPVGSAEASFDDIAERPPELDVPEEGVARLLMRKIIRVVFGVWVLGTALGIYMSLMPEPFDVSRAAMARALRSGHIADGEALPNGYTTIATLAELGELMLSKNGGLMSNDWNPVSRITDNMRNWEKGAMTQIRRMSLGLLSHLTRIGPQSEEQRELTDAFPLYNWKETSLIVPSSERQYKQANRLLNQYLARMSAEGASPGEFFAPRQDQVIEFLKLQTNILGSYTTLLQQNVRIPTYSANILSSEDPVATRLQVNSPWKRDDVFYEVRGGVFVTYHMMLALRKDAEGLLNGSDAMGIMNRVINELESANQPMISPVVLNGNEFGFFANHSLVLASHVARAHLAMRELQQQLSGGSGL
jgi:hypothetical protein